VRYADAGRNTQFKLDPVTDLPRDGHRISEESYTARHVQPVLVQAEGLYLVGVVLVDLPGYAADTDILVHVRREDHQIGTPLPGLPDGHARFHAIGLGDIICGEHNPVPLLLAAA